MFVYYGIINKEDNYVQQNLFTNLYEILMDYNKKFDIHPIHQLTDVNTIISENFQTYICLLSLLEQDSNFYVEIFKSM